MDLPATLNVESNNYGHTVLTILVDQLDYMNLYSNVDYSKRDVKLAPIWGTNVQDKSRVQLVMLGESRLKSGQWEIWSPYFIEEMADFQITNIKHIDALAKEIMADAGKAEGKVLDDRLFAGFHALWACNAMNPEMVLERERRRLKRIVEEKARVENIDKKPITWRNSECSYAQMMAEQDYPAGS
jgi:hypothetical protein